MDEWIASCSAEATPCTSPVCDAGADEGGEVRGKMVGSIIDRMGNTLLTVPGDSENSPGDVAVDAVVLVTFSISSACCGGGSST